MVAVLVLAAATVLAYSNSLDASFHFDDVDNILRNASIRDLSRQWPPSGNRWLGFLSFALNYRLGGLAVFGYHLVNLLIHVCNGLLVFGLATTTLRTPALRRAEAGPLVARYMPLAASLVFALHPVQTQAVTYIVQRFTSLATLFYLLSLVLYAQARLSLEREPGLKRSAAVLYGLSVLAAAGAMKTKEISFTLPFVAGAYELLFFRTRRRWLLLVPLGATALLVPFGLATQGRSLADVLADASHLAAETPDIPRSTYLLTQSRVVVTYVRLLVLPVGQNLDYDYRLSHSLADPGVLLSLAILLAVVSGGVLLLRRARQTNRAPGVLVFFGVAWFFVTLSVESSVIPIRDVIFEHRMYLPTVGAAIALSTGLLSIVERLRLRLAPELQLTVALLLTAGPLGIATYARNLVWKDEITLWNNVVSKSPRKARPRTILGLVYTANGKLDDALRESLEAVRLDPRDSYARNNLGVVYKAKGRIEEAVREYREAIRLQPRQAEAHSNLADVWNATGQFDAAMRECQEAIRLDPALPEARVNLGTAYAGKGRIEDAVRELREAIRLKPALTEAHAQLGNAYVAKGQLDDAVREFQEAIRLDPRDAKVHDDLANAYRSKGQLDDAAREHRDATRLDPGMVQTLTPVGEAYKPKGPTDGAVRQ